jgi:AraC-like DNA-binding protein
MSAHTPQRRLAAEGITYSGLLASIRTWQAKGLLVDAEMPIADFDAEFGYPYPSVFGRAFRHETGLLALAFRCSQGLD